jgi:hypothetical protein
MHGMITLTTQILGGGWNTFATPHLKMWGVNRPNPRGVYAHVPGRPSANDAAVCQRSARPNVARMICVSVAPRARRVPRSIHHQQIGVVFQLPVTDLQSLDELEKSLQQSCIISIRLKAIGSSLRATLRCRTGMAANSEYRLAYASGELIV